MSSGKIWEARIARENQKLLDERRAMVARVPTHYHGGIPSRDPKVDFVGLLAGGRMVAIEAKANTGSLRPEQRAYLQGVAMFGGLALVYRRIDGERHLCTVDKQGNMQRKSAETKCELDTWLDELEPPEATRAAAIEEAIDHLKAGRMTLALAILQHVSERYR